MHSNLSKRVISAVLALVLTLGCVVMMPTTAEAASGNSIYDAVEMTFGATYYKYWTSSNDHLNHYVKFTMPQRGIVTFKVDKPYDAEGEAGKIEFIMYDADGEVIWGNESYKAQDNARTYYTFSVGLDAGVYYVCMDPGFYVSSGIIDMSYTATYTQTDYCEVESNDGASYATFMEEDHMYIGYYSSDGSNYEDSDYFKFNVTAGHIYRLTFDNYGKMDSTSTIDKLNLPTTGVKSPYFSNIDSEGRNYAEFKPEYSGTAYYYLYNCSGYEQYWYGLMIEDVTCGGNHTYKNNVCTVCGRKAIDITSQPTGQKVKAGTTATFSVEATGSGLSYQWQYRTSSSGTWAATTATGNKTNTLKVAATAAKTGYQYRCKITDSAGRVVYTNAVYMYVLGITSQPTGQKVAAGTTATFTVAATGHNKTFQWQYRTSSSGTWENTTATGNKTATLKVAATAAKSGYQYRCVITDSAGNTVTSNAVYMYVLGIKTQPTGQKVVAGSTATFTVSATGHNKTFQWQYRTSSSGTWKNCTATGNKTATMKVPATTGKSGWQYRCVITDSVGNTVTTNTVYLYVLGITSQPTDATVSAGTNAKFTVAATGHSKTYQWEYRTSADGEWKTTTATGNKSATLTVITTAAKNGYQYRCKITDSVGNVIYSNVVTLNVN